MEEATEPIELTVPKGPSVTDPLLGTIIDQRYQVLSAISRGGMATVYRAIDERLDREVALKVMHPHLAESTDLVARFRREARATARLTHPGVVAVYDQGVINGQGYLVMELVSGPNLRYVLRSEGSFTVREAFDMVEQILSALATAHHSGLIHRDVKPENVLVPSRNNLKVADFGLARAVSDVTMASTGSVLGTVGYLAPELVTGGDVDPRSDVYSVGIMLYELISGHLPYSGETPIQVAFAHVHRDIPALSEEVEWIPTEIDDLIAALCSRNIDERPQDADTALAYVKATRETIGEEILNRRADVAPTVTEAEITAENERSAKVGSNAKTQAIDFGYGTAALPLTDSVEECSRKKRKRTITWLVVSLLVLLLSGLGGAGYAYWYYEYGAGSYISVPNLHGLSSTQAQSRLKASQIKFKIKEEYSDTVDQDLVIKSTPDAGQKISKHGTLILYVSKGIEYVTIPDVVKMTLTDAEATLKKNKLHIDTEKTQEVYDEKIPKDTVISIEPKAGESVKHDSKVVLVVSKGREPIKVPNLAGKTQADAEKAISDLGLLSSVSWDVSDTVPRGQVMKQTPAADSTLYKGDTVTFVISKGPAMVTIPKTSWDKPDDAKAKLEKLGFVVKFDRSDQFFNLVKGTNPKAGTSVPNGSTVTIIVG